MSRQLPGLEQIKSTVLPLERSTVLHLKMTLDFSLRLNLLCIDVHIGYPRPSPRIEHLTAPVGEVT